VRGFDGTDDSKTYVGLRHTSAASVANHNTTKSAGRLEKKTPVCGWNGVL
jgi:hypothetical protein